jgi:hypothetical protein
LRTRGDRLSARVNGAAGTLSTPADPQAISGQPFATVPYTVHLNDVASFDFLDSTPPPGLPSRST